MVGFIRGLRAIVVLPALVLAWMGCSSNTEIGNPKSQSVIAFESGSAVERYLRDQLREDIVRKTPMDGGAESPAPAPDDDFAPPPAARESAVRNPVIVTDTAIFAAGTEQVNVLVRSPGNPPEMVGAISGTGRIRSLHRFEELLVVVGGVEGGEAEPVRQRVSVWEAADPERPTMIREWEIDGAYLGATATSGTLYLAHQFLPAIPPFAEGGAFGENAEENLGALAALPSEALIPNYVFREGEGGIVSRGVLTASAAFFRPDWPAGGALTALTALDLSGAAGMPFSAALAGNVSGVFFGEDSAAFSIVRSGDRAIDEDLFAAPGDAETTLYRLPFSDGKPTVSHFGLLPGIIPASGAVRVQGERFQALTVSASASEWEVRATALRLDETRLAFEGLRFLGLETEIPNVRYDGTVQWVLFADGRVLGVDFSDPGALPEIGPAILEGEPIAPAPLAGNAFLVALRRESELNGNASMEFQRLTRENGRLASLAPDVSIPIPGSASDSRWLLDEVAVDAASNQIVVPLRIIPGPSGAGAALGRVFILRQTQDGGLQVAGEVDVETALPPGENLPARWIPRFLGTRFGLFSPDGFIFGETADPSGTARWIPFVPVQSS